MELPDLKGREAILYVHGSSVKMDDTVDFNAIARATSGASGAELANIINEAALRAVRLGPQSRLPGGSGGERGDSHRRIPEKGCGGV